MPPKEAKGASKKAVDKQKQKIIEDKTFGLKNKNKSKKVEAFIKSVTTQVNNRGGLDARAAELARQKKEEKERAAAAQKELEELFKPVVKQAKVPLGVDPKSVVCELFRAGACTKGKKCKYSHDLAVERKAQKIDLYTDARGEKEKDLMETWDQSKLEGVVDQKQGQVNRNLKTKIVCKYFLDAIEDKKYGWFWECPNGGEKCQYVHALPPGFVLKSKKVEEDEEEPTPLEEIIEEERKKLTKHTPVTKENFLIWKEEKRKKKEEARKIAEDKRMADIKAGKTVMSGREMFVFNPDVFVDDDAALEIDDEDLGENGPTDEIETSTDYFGNNQEGESEGDALTVEVNRSLFVDDDIPDDEDDE